LFKSTFEQCCIITDLPLEKVAEDGKKEAESSDSEVEEGDGDQKKKKKKVSVYCPGLSAQNHVLQYFLER